MLPDLESIRCYLAAMEHLHFRRAARAVSLSPAAFSQRIAALEELVGGALFERTTRRVQPTGLGLRLREPAAQLLASAREWASPDEDAPTPCELVIGTRFELGLSWIVPALPQLLAERPTQRLHLAFGTGPDLLARLRGGEIDAVVTSTRLAQPGLRYQVLHREDYVFVAAPGQCDAVSVGPVDARGMVLVDAHRDLPLFRYFLDATPASEFWTFGRVETMGTIAAVRARILSGHGVGVLPEYFVRGDLAAGELVRLRPDVELIHDFFRLVWREHHALDTELVNLAGRLRGLELR